MSFLARRLFRLAAVAVAVPLAGTAAVKLAERLERDSGPSAKTRVLRYAGGSLSRRRR